MKLTHIAVAGLISVSALAVSIVSFAHPVYDTDIVYFSDATMTTVIGESEVYCTGASSSWGSTSLFKKIDQTSCDGGGRGNCSPIGCENPNP